MNNLFEHMDWGKWMQDFNNSSFEEKALELFQWQYAGNEVYRSFTNQMFGYDYRPSGMQDIPFLPISFFKSQMVKTGNVQEAAIFESSGTTGSVNSKHFVKDLAIYRSAFLAAFKKFYGDPADWCILGLLPSYLERANSSLVMMVDELIQLSGHSNSGFYLHDHDALHDTLVQVESKGQKTLLIGVTFALLDFAEKFSMRLKHTTIMETGGMKGRRKEMTRDEVHGILKSAFGLGSIHSEYGMTELLSQGYSLGDGIFHTSDTLKILIRDEDDPLSVHSHGTGVINVIDLANIWSCAFIATDDLGKLYLDGSFEVLGRVDYSDIRGCSQMTI
ncbi:MAG: acyl transferase [Chitinophagaceae bacterium]